MKTLIALICLCSFARAENYQSVTAETQTRIGKPTWKIRISSPQFAKESLGGSELEFYRKPPERGSLDAPASPLSPLDYARGQISEKNPILRIKSAANAPDFLALAVKFMEWASVAKTNRVRDFEKEIGKVGETTQALVFVVSGGVRELKITNPYSTSVTLPESEVSDIVFLLRKVPELSLNLSRQIPKDPTDQLFK